MTDDTASLDALGQARLVARGDMSPLELVDAAIARVEKLNPELNAVIHERFDRARSEAASPSLAAGPLRGVPIVVKDLDGWLADEPWHGGIRYLKDAGWKAPADSAFFRRLKEAGCVIVGKTNTPELGLVTTTESEAYGPARNPWNTAHSTGGSSGGSGAAVASRMVPAGHAGDGGGSIRIPASECGLVGLKPSRGRVSLAPEAGEAWAGFVARLMLTHTVRDTAAFLDVVSGEEPGDPYTAPPPGRAYADEVGAPPGALRIGVRLEPTGGFPIDPEVAAAVDAAAGWLSELGHHVEAVSPAALNEDLSGFVVPLITTFAAHDLDVAGANLGRVIPESGVEPGTWASAEVGRTVTGPQYMAAVDDAHAFTRRLVRWWTGGFDVLVTPTIPELPPTLGQFKAVEGNPYVGAFRASSLIPFTMPFNVSGQPAVSLPLGVSAEGLPIGVQFISAPHREDVLIRLASQLEEARPWTDRRPPVCA